MDIRFLETFMIVAECGSIAEAARRLNLTAAAVAQRIHTLEKELGQVLLIRAGRTMRPTAAGLAILERSPAIIDQVKELSVAAANDLPTGQLRIGAAATALTGLVPAIIADLSRTYPAIDYFLMPGSSADLYGALQTGQLDVAIIVQPPFALPKVMGWEVLRHEPLLLLAPEKLSVQDPRTTIAGQPFIRYDRNQWGGQLVDRYLRRHNLTVREWVELDALDSIAALVDRGLGVSLVPNWAPPWPEGLKLQKILLHDGDIRQMGVLWRRSGPKTAAIQAFIETCRAVALIQ